MAAVHVRAPIHPTDRPFQEHRKTPPHSEHCEAPLQSPDLHIDRPLHEVHSVPNELQVPPFFASLLPTSVRERRKEGGRRKKSFRVRAVEDDLQLEYT